MVTYADRPWLQYYDDHVPASLEPYPEKALHDYLRETAAKAPDTTALVTTVRLPVVGRLNSAFTYRELDEQSDALAAALIAMGIQKGDRVAVMMPNVTAFAVSYYAILKAGGVMAAMNPTYPVKRLAYQMSDSGAKVAICMSLFYKDLQSVQSDTDLEQIIVTNVKDYFPALARTLFTLLAEKKGGHRVEQLGAQDRWLLDVLAEYKGQTPKVDVQPDDLALFQYTGGTTGVSKGAMGTHRALVANSVALQAWGGLSTARYDHIDPKKFLGALPLFHVYGLVALLTQTVNTGAELILVPNARDIDDLIDIIHAHQPHVFLGVPALYNAINEHPRIKSGEVSLKCFILSTSGSAPLPKQTKEDYDAQSGSAIVEAYGLSETFVAVTATPVHGEQPIRSTGIPYPDIDLKIVSLDEPDETVPLGEVGEIVIASPSLMVGYHGMPTETANALRKDADGRVWFYTGDIGRMDERGYLFIVDRKKDMALIGGYNVYPTTVEDVLKQHPAVFEVGVAGIPHPNKVGQEALKAWIVPKQDASVTEEDLIAHCETLLAPYEIPRRFSFVSEIPKTAVGKTLRRELVRLEMQEATEREPA